MLIAFASPREGELAAMTREHVDLRRNLLIVPRGKTVSRLSQAIAEVMKDEDTRRKFHDAKMVPVSATAAQTAAMLKAYRAQWAPVVQKSGYQP